MEADSIRRDAPPMQVMRAAEAEAETGGDEAELSGDEAELVKDEPQPTEENELELA